MQDLFEKCKAIAIEIDNGNEPKAREDLIFLLNDCKKQSIAYTPFLNHLIRQLGLFPYMKGDAIWQDCVAKNFFEADIGTPDPAVLHIDQSYILRMLLDGKDLLVSAPTSFGKSFIIDAYIATKKPNNVVIILPTVALTDETRRRLHNKFGRQYNIITQQDEEIKERNLFIFPQERAFSYIGQFPQIDLLIVDEFYKAAPSIQDERNASLVKIIIELKKSAKQCYFIAPDFELDPDMYPLTRGMKLLSTNKFTVFTDIIEKYKKIEQEENKIAQKESILVDLLKTSQKNLIYAGDPSKIKEVSDIVLAKIEKCDSRILSSFSSYLIEQYGADYRLVELVQRGVGIHDGKIHRPLAQLQIKLFSETMGLSSVISSSSIIEGVNTSAENVILWSNKIANKLLTSYSYNNIIGRAGRMFKYFVGRVFLLEEPPVVNKPQTLSLEYTDEVISSIEESDREQELTKEQITKIKIKELEFDNCWGRGTYRKLRETIKGGLFDIEQIDTILSEITADNNIWNDENLNRFTDSDVSKWSFRIIQSVSKIANFHKVNIKKIMQALSHNWIHSVPDIIKKMPKAKRSVESYFDYERQIAYKIPKVLALIVSVYNCYYRRNIDISMTLSRISNAFLPKLVYQLEEYGLPRSLSKKIVNAGLIKLDNPDMTLANAIGQFKEIGKDKLSKTIPYMHDFENYILEHFYSGI